MIPAAECLKPYSKKRRGTTWGETLIPPEGDFGTEVGIVPPGPSKREWEKIVSRAATGVAFARLRARTEMLERDISDLQVEIVALKENTPSIAVLNALPEPEYLLKAPIVVSVKLVYDEFLASFDDASIAASGETQSQAIENLKSMILDVFDLLSSKDLENIGPLPQKQLAILNSFIEIQE